MTINPKKIDEESTAYSSKLDKSDRLQHAASSDENSKKSKVETGDW